MKLIAKLIFRSCLLAPLVAFSQTPVATTNSLKAIAPAQPVKTASVEGFTEYRLGNGLRVLLAPDSSKPTLTTNIIYMVGSRNENYGETGMAHLLEHLLFKPSANFGVKKGTQNPVQVLNAIGGSFNGTTSYDRTNYYAVFPANDANLHLMLSLEADRMVNAAIDQDDLWNRKTNKGEMTVVRNEFERNENDPEYVTVERMQAVAFDWHNYGKATIGARSDIENVNIAHLKAFYKKYYQPDNAILLVAGRFDEVKVLNQINAAFGVIPKPTRVIEPTYTTEPVQDGERSVTVRRSGGIQYVGAGYHMPPTSHVDAAAVRILGRIMANTPGGRLHKALVETKLASQVDQQANSNLEPSYRIFGAIVPKDGDLDQVQSTMLKVLEGVKEQPITEEEVVRAKQELSKEVDLLSSDTINLAIQLTDWMAAGDWRLYFLRRDQMEKVTRADVQAAAENYLQASNHTIGRFIPTSTIDRANIPAKQNVAAIVKDYKGRAVVAQGEVFDASPANIDNRTQRFTLPGGLQAALLPKKTKGNSVSVAIQLRIGSEASLTGKAQIGVFAAEMLMRGSQQHSREELKAAFDKLKASVGIEGNAEAVTVRISTVRENLPATLDLVTEVLEHPAFSPDEFARLQNELVAAVEQTIPEPDAQAWAASQRILDATPENHVRHVLSLQENARALKATKLDETKSFYGSSYGASAATVAIVGDFDAAAVKEQLTRNFASWKSGQDYIRIPRTVKNSASTRIQLETPDKSNAMLFAVQALAVKDDDPDYPAFLIANHILGGGALHSRLADRIRQKEGLSYGVGSQLVVYPFEPAGFWMTYAISAPQNMAKVEAALREELQKAVKDGFTEAELTEAKTAWQQSQQVGRTDDNALASRLMEYLGAKRTMNYDKDLEAKVAALTLAQVNQALRNYLKPEKVSVTVAGDFAKAKADDLKK